MLFVGISNVRPGMIQEATRRRLDWEPPKSVHVVAEYWLPTDHPKVLLFFEAEGANAIFESINEWADLFETQVYPALPATEGLALAREMAARHEGTLAHAGA
jgi:hypothetical protein